MMGANKEPIYVSSDKQLPNHIPNVTTPFIEFENGSVIRTITSTDSCRGKRAELGEPVEDMIYSKEVLDDLLRYYPFTKEGYKNNLKWHKKLRVRVSWFFYKLKFWR